MPEAAALFARGIGEALRATYLAEVERFAASLRARFRLGELRGFCSEDWDRGLERSPHWRIERLAATWFGLQVRRAKGRGPCGDERTARLVLAASPHAGGTDSAGGWEHVCFHAQAAIAWDVIALARERGWYVPAKDESDEPVSRA